MTPIHQITSKLSRMKLADGNRLLEQIIAAEKPRSVRRNELESLLKSRKTKEIAKETPARRRRRKYRAALAA
jgi:phage tail sheath gpL-like